MNHESAHSTQHGTKGSEFERVVVVLDDDEGRYTLYSYDKFLGLKELSDNDLENQAQGRDSAVERTRRLFYVCVSRAKHSLAMVLTLRCRCFAGRGRGATVCIGCARRPSDGLGSGYFDHEFIRGRTVLAVAVSIDLGQWRR